MFSGHTTAFVIDDISSRSIGAALFALQARVGTNIQQIYRDNSSYFGEAVLSRMEIDNFRVQLEQSVKEVDMHISVHPNLSYTKCRNVPERVIKELRKFSKQTR